MVYFVSNKTKKKRSTKSRKNSFEGKESDNKAFNSQMTVVVSSLKKTTDTISEIKVPEPAKSLSDSKKDVSGLNEMVPNWLNKRVISTRYKKVLI
jgi:hypothetical protein